MLMRIAEYIDTHMEKETLRAWILGSKDEVLSMLVEAEERRCSVSNGVSAMQGKRQVSLTIPLALPVPFLHISLNNGAFGVNNTMCVYRLRDD